MRRFLLNIPALIALALLCALAAPTANAQDIPSRMESVDVFIDVQQNGDMLVQETFVYAFRRQGISFTCCPFPLESVDDVDQVSISMDGRDLPVEIDRGERRIRLDWEHPPVHPPETHTFVLRYRVRGGLNFGEEQDSVTWEAMPGNRGELYYIDRGSVTVRVPRSVAGQQRIESLGGDADSLVLDVRTVKFTLLEGLPIEEYLAVSVFFPHGLVDDPNPPWKRAASSFFQKTRLNRLFPDADRVHAGEPSWVFQMTGLVDRFPDADWTRATDWLYWALRFSVFGLVVLLFLACRIRKSRWPAADFPSVGTVTRLPSDLPAPVVSVLGSRKVNPQTYLSILVDMLQKGNLTMTGGYGHGENRGLHSNVTFVRQFEPDRPWEKVVYDVLPDSRTTAEGLKSLLQKQEKAIRPHLDGYLLARGFFDELPLQGMADQGQGRVAQLGWFLATAIFALGVGLWVNLWLPWWAGAGIAIVPAFLFGGVALDSSAGRLIPTQTGAHEMSRWSSFGTSLALKHVSPSLDPSQPDPLLPYAVALDAAERWVNHTDAVPPWFLPRGPGRYYAYRGFIGADSWDLSGGPKIKAYESSRGGGGGGGDGGGDGGGG